MGNTKVYGSVQEVENRYVSSKPIPVVIFENGTVGCLLYERGRNVGKDLVAIIIKKWICQQMNKFTMVFTTGSMI
jgi:hypothetical protein